MPVYLKEDQLLKYGQHAAFCIGMPMQVPYAPKTEQEARKFIPHRWVLEAIQSAFLDGQRYAKGETNSRMAQYGIVPRAMDQDAGKS